MNEKYINHEEAHMAINTWCIQASDLFREMIERMEALEAQVDNLNARVREWEVGPR